MIYRKLGKCNCEVSQIGVGCMRFPMIDGTIDLMNPQKPIDEEAAINMIRHAIDEGINYFDTAYPYLGFRSEEILGKALQGEYRKKAYIATKMPVWIVTEEDDFEMIFNDQLQKLGTDYIDFYLLHGLSKHIWEKSLDMNILKFLDKILADGRAHYVGFSFHDDYEAFKSIVDAYDWSMCQIQLNYLDGNYQAGVRGMKYAAEKGMGVVIMEPLRGGKLAANQPKDIQEIWDGAEVKRTPVDWALRWIWNYPEVTCVLSGASFIEQLNENIKIANDCKPQSLTTKELKMYTKVKDIYRKRMKINCTGCAYCMPCPAGVRIPDNFSLYNQIYMYDDRFMPEQLYVHMTPEQRASNCKSCGACEVHCPQKIQIREMLKEVKKEFDNLDESAGLEHGSVGI